MAKYNACDNGAVKCPKCGGKGTVDTGMFRTGTEERKLCDGAGTKPCGVCKGKGTV